MQQILLYLGLFTALLMLYCLFLLEGKQGRSQFLFFNGIFLTVNLKGAFLFLSGSAWT